MTLRRPKQEQMEVSLFLKNCLVSKTQLELVMFEQKLIQNRKPVAW